MARKNDSWGIEVGQFAIKAIRLVRNGDRVNVADYAVVPFRKVLSTPDLDVDEQIQLGLDQLLSSREIGKSTVVISVPGHMAFARFAKLPPVEPKKIPDIVKFEAAQQVPFPIDQVEWDYHVFSQDDSPEVEVGIFAITAEKVADFMEDYRHAEIPIDALTLSPLAVFNAMVYDLDLTEESRGVVMLDIGTTSTDVIIFDEGKLWLRTLQIGGNDFTEALVKSFKLSFSKAEKLKREAGTSKYARQIFTAMRPVFSDLVQDVQRTIGYYQSLNRDVQLEKLIGFGSTFRLPGLRKYFKQQIQMEVVRPDGFSQIAVEGKQASDFADHTLNLATAYGLALQGLGLSGIDANVLPTPVVRQRMWAAKRPWFAAAAAMLAVPPILVWANVIAASAAHGSAAEKTKHVITAPIQQANKLQREFRDIARERDPGPKIENLNRILDYRDFWSKLLSDINHAMASLQPQPELLNNDYEKILLIPPDERRRIYVKETKVKYLFEPKPEGFSAKSGTTGQDYGKLFGKRNYRYQVSLVGLTTLPSPERIINDHLINWFKENGNRPDRPYIVDAGKISTDYINPIEPEDEDLDQQGGLNAAGAGGGQGIGNRFGNNPAMPGAFRPMPGGRGGMVRGGGGGKAGLKELLPKRPTAKEPGRLEYEFSVTWTITIAIPDAARMAELGRRDTSPPEEKQPKTKRSKRRRRSATQ